MFRVILSALLFAVFSLMPATASFADIEGETEFARRHLDVKPASGWKKGGNWFRHICRMHALC